MAITLASWNVNSIKARLPIVQDWVAENQPDIVGFQEIKCVEENFPALEFQSLDYRVEAVGQKSYNGVAILSRRPFEVTARALPGDPDDAEARYIEIEIEGSDRPFRVGNLYLPNGNGGTEKYTKKITWMKRLRDHAAELSEADIDFALIGDYNVIPEPEDCYDPADWQDDALFRLDTRLEFQGLVNLGLTDAFRALQPTEEGAFTFWDYQAGRWQRDEGIRIDHILLSPTLADRLDRCWIDRQPRGREKASDHTPILCRLS